MNLTRNLKQTATLWTAGSLDSYGSPSWTRSTTKCRWEEGNKLIRDSDGNEIISTSTVYLPTDVSLGDYLYLGTSAESSPIEGSYKVLDFQKTPSIDGKKFIRKAML